MPRRLTRRAWTIRSRIGRWQEHCPAAGSRVSVLDVGGTDARLAARLAAGDDLALAEVFDRLASAVYSAALRVPGTCAAAQDVVQDVFVALWIHPGRYDPAAGTLRTSCGAGPAPGRGSGAGRTAPDRAAGAAPAADAQGRQSPSPCERCRPRKPPARCGRRSACCQTSSAGSSSSPTSRG